MVFPTKRAAGKEIQHDQWEKAMKGYSGKEWEKEGEV